MPALLIKDIPEDLHVQLKRRAARNHRSLTKEALAILENALRNHPERPTLGEIDRRRVKPKEPITAAYIRRAIRQGRA